MSSYCDLFTMLRIRDSISSSLIIQDCRFSQLPTVASRNSLLLLQISGLGPSTLGSSNSNPYKHNHGLSLRS